MQRGEVQVASWRVFLVAARITSDSLPCPVLQADQLPGDGTYLQDNYIVSSLLGSVHIAPPQTGSTDQVGWPHQCTASALDRTQSERRPTIVLTKCCCRGQQSRSSAAEPAPRCQRRGTSSSQRSHATLQTHACMHIGLCSLHERPQVGIGCRSRG